MGLSMSRTTAPVWPDRGRSGAPGHRADCARGGRQPQQAVTLGVAKEQLACQIPVRATAPVRDHVKRHVRPDADDERCEGMAAEQPADDDAREYVIRDEHV